MIKINQMYGKIDLSIIDLLSNFEEKQIGLELAFTDTGFLYSRTDLNDELICKINSINREILVHLPFYGLSLGCKDSNVKNFSVDIIKRSLDFCKKINVKKATFHPARLPMLSKNGKLKWYKTFRESVQSILKTAEKNDIILCAENTWEYDADLFLNLFNDVKSEKLKLCLDIAHIFCFSKEKSIEYWTDNLGDSIAHIHLSDNFYQEDSHLSLGKGKIDFTKIPITENLTYTMEVKPELWGDSLNHLKNIGILETTV